METIKCTECEALENGDIIRCNQNGDCLICGRKANEHLSKSMDNIEEEKTNKNDENPYLDESKKFKEGNPGGGRPKDTLEDKIIKKATKQLIAEYKEGLSEALVLIRPVLIAKALEGDVSAIKEIHDRTMDKAKQPTDINLEGNITQGVVFLPSKDELDTTTNTEDSIS